MIYVTLLFIACKTASQIREEQLFSNLTSQVSKGQELSAVTQVRMDRLENEISKIRSKHEELNHSLQNNLSDSSKKWNSSLQIYEEKILKLEKEVELLRKDIFLLQKGILQKEKISYASANRAYEQKKYAQAIREYQFLIDNQKISGYALEHAHYNLGMSNYLLKNYDNANIYLSKLIVNFPKSTFIPRAMINMAKSFIAQKKKEEARTLLQKFKADFPQDKRMGEVERILSTL